MCPSYQTQLPQRIDLSICTAPYYGYASSRVSLQCLESREPTPLDPQSELATHRK